MSICRKKSPLFSTFQNLCRQNLLNKNIPHTKRKKMGEIFEKIFEKSFEKSSRRKPKTACSLFGMLILMVTAILHTKCTFFLFFSLFFVKSV